METAIKVIMAVVIVGVIIAAVGTVGGAFSTATGAAGAGLSWMSDSMNWHDAAPIGGTSFGPKDVLGYIQAMIFPGTHTEGGGLEYAGDPSQTSWVLVLLAALPVGIIAWMVVVKLIGLLFGSG